MRKILFVSLMLSLVASGAACGKKSAPRGTGPSAGATSECRADVQGTKGKKPAVTVSPGKAPAALVKKDITVGTGDEAKIGKTAVMQYVGLACSTGKQFDASWDRGQPLPFPVGGGQVIQGWDQGVPGMKVGGRRLLIIPPELGYGAQGTGPIGPNETLVFVVDLVEVRER